MVRKIRVADYTIEVHGSSFAGMMDCSGSFSDFMIDGEADFRVMSAPLSQLHDIVSEADERYEFSFENVVCRFYECREGICYTMSEQSICANGTSPCEADRYIALHWSYGDDFLTVSDGCKNLSMVRFALWMALNILMIPNKCAAVHSSVNIFSGEAVMFLGESGTGKSTHTRLLRERYPLMFLLNDDSPFVRVLESGKIMVYGSPWSGKTPCYKQLHYPLRAMVRLRQAPCNKISRLSPLASIGALLPSAPPAFNYVQKMADMNCDFVSDIVSSVPLYSLECLPDTAAAELSFSTVFC